MPQGCLCGRSLGTPTGCILHLSHWRHFWLLLFIDWTNLPSYGHCDVSGSLGAHHGREPSVGHDGQSGQHNQAGVGKFGVQHDSCGYSPISVRIRPSGFLPNIISVVDHHWGVVATLSVKEPQRFRAHQYAGSIWLCSDNYRHGVRYFDGSYAEGGKFETVRLSVLQRHQNVRLDPQTLYHRLISILSALPLYTGYGGRVSTCLWKRGCKRCLDQPLSIGACVYAFRGICGALQRSTFLHRIEKQHRPTICMDDNVFLWSFKCDLLPGHGLWISDLWQGM